MLVTFQKHLEKSIALFIDLDFDLYMCLLQVFIYPLNRERNAHKPCPGSLM